MTKDIKSAPLTLNALKALGVTLCVDDFGTGCSSPSYLHRLPVVPANLTNWIEHRVAV